MLLSRASADPHRVAWLALGKVFSAFMTGNVVFIAVGLCSHDSDLALHAAAAVCAFGAGALATASLMPREAPALLWPSRVTLGQRRLAMVLGGTLIGALAGALLLAHARLWMPLLPAVLTAGIAVVGRFRVERCTGAAQTTVSSAPRPLTRAFGRTADKARAVSNGR
jgi:uncharacterized membrane protein YoaK (UPF0700 family)